MAAGESIQEERDEELQVCEGGRGWSPVFEKSGSGGVRQLPAAFDCS